MLRWWCVFLVLPAVSMTQAQSRPPSQDDMTTFLKRMNVGKAYLENRNSVKAIKAFEAAIQLRPTSLPALRNLARAHMLARKYEPALRYLADAKRFDSGSVTTEYLTGVAKARMSRFEEAIPYLEEAVRLDPHTAALRFQLAISYQAIGAHEKAAQQLEETVSLDPLHGAAHFRLANYARQAGDREVFESRYREFVRLKKLFGEAVRKPEMLERCIHTRPESALSEPRQGLARSKQHDIEVRFRDATSVWSANELKGLVTAVAILELDERGRPVLLVGGADGALALLRLSDTMRYVRTPVDAGLPSSARIRRLLVGNFQDMVPKGVKYNPRAHAKNDVLVLGPDRVWLLRRVDEAKFEDVTVAAGFETLRADDATWVDIEHDGDLDLAFAGSNGLAVWQNNGDGTFVDVTREIGIADTGPVSSVGAVDLNADVAIDLVVARCSRGTLVYHNKRAGRFGLMPEPPGPWPAAQRLLLNDLNNDAWPDAVLLSDDGATIIPGRSAGRKTISMPDFKPSSGVLIDYDNDSYLDLCVVGTTRSNPSRGRIRLWRGDGNEAWLEVEGVLGNSTADLPPLLDVIAVDVDGDADTDLILLTATGHLRWLRNDGGDRNGQLKIRLLAIKSNPSGLGVHVELRAGDFWVTRTVTGAAIEIGLGGRKRLDAVQTVWTTGVVDNLIEVETGADPVIIEEKNVATGSCPFLYVWDGSGFRFVTDILGNAPIGLPVARDVLLPADPDEIVYLGTMHTVRPRAGRYEVQLTSEFCEVLYLDNAQLMVVDHAPDLEVHPTDKLMPAPFPRSELYFLGSVRPPLEALGDDGIDRTSAIASIDGNFAPPGAPLPAPFRGMCHPLALTLDFGCLSIDKPLVLALTGWLAYGQASSNIALSQSSAHVVIPPRLEIEGPDGRWRSVDVVVGMPAGKTKTILCDLTGKLPVGSKRLRLTTTFEIRWDRIALGERVQPASAHIRSLSPATADLQWRGFSKIEARAPGHPTTPDHAVVWDRPPWRRTLQGWCTQYGNVLALAVERDNRLVLVNAGDALNLTFKADDLPALRAGARRTFFFRTFGWEKDCDHNVSDGDQVAPLPISDNHTEPLEAEDDWRIRYNTRWVPGDQFKPEQRLSPAHD